MQEVMQNEKTSPGQEPGDRYAEKAVPSQKKQKTAKAKSPEVCNCDCDGHERVLAAITDFRTDISAAPEPKR